jgi:hypothetical protein
MSRNYVVAVDRLFHTTEKVTIDSLIDSIREQVRFNNIFDHDWWRLSLFIVWSSLDLDGKCNHRIITYAWLEQLYMNTSFVSSDRWFSSLMNCTTRVQTCMHLFEERIRLDYFMKIKMHTCMCILTINRKILIELNDKIESS